MQEKVKIIAIFFTVSVIIGIISNFILSFAFSSFFAGDPGQQTEVVAAPFMATGIASGAFTILLLFYPVVKFGDRTHTWEDYK